MTEGQHNDEKKGRRDMPTAAPTSASTGSDVVQISTRVDRSLRQRLKMAAAREDVSVQEIQKRAFEEYLTRQGL